MMTAEEVRALALDSEVDSYTYELRGKALEEYAAILEAAEAQEPTPGQVAAETQRLFSRRSPGVAIAEVISAERLRAAVDKNRAISQIEARWMNASEAYEEIDALKKQIMEAMTPPKLPKGMCECGTSKETCDRIRYNFSAENHWQRIAARQKAKVARLELQVGTLRAALDETQKDVCIKMCDHDDIGVLRYVDHHRICVAARAALAIKPPELYAKVIELRAEVRKLKAKARKR